MKCRNVLLSLSIILLSSCSNILPSSLGTSSEDFVCSVPSIEYPGTHNDNNNEYSYLIENYERGTFAVYLYNKDNNEYIKLVNNEYTKISNFTTYNLFVFSPEYGNISKNDLSNFNVMFNNEIVSINDEIIYSFSDKDNCGEIQSRFYCMITEFCIYQRINDTNFALNVNYQSYSHNSIFVVEDLVKPKHELPNSVEILDVFYNLKEVLLSIEKHIPTFPITKETATNIDWNQNHDESLGISFWKRNAEYDLQYSLLLHDNVLVPKKFPVVMYSENCSNIFTEIKSNNINELYIRNTPIVQQDVIEYFYISSDVEDEEHMPISDKFRELTYKVFPKATANIEEKKYLENYPEHFLKTDINGLEIYLSLNDKSGKYKTLNAYFFDENYFYMAFSRIVK